MLVFQGDEATCVSWRLLESMGRCRCLSVSDLTELKNTSRRGSIIDFCGFDAGGEPGLKHQLVAEMRARDSVLFLPLPTTAEALRWYRELIAEVPAPVSHLFFRAPSLYSACLLELRQILSNNRMGAPVGFDIQVRINPHFILDAFDLVRYFNGRPEGYRCGRSPDSQSGTSIGGILWYNKAALRFAVENTLEGFMAEGTVACRGGSVEFTIGESGWLFCSPAGNPAYSVALPEGDGYYYGNLDVCESVQSNSGSLILPAAKALEIRSWSLEVLQTI